MKKISIGLCLVIFLFEINSSIKIIDYDAILKIPDSGEFSVAEPKQDEPFELLNFKLGSIDGDLSIVGDWRIKIGYGAGFTLYPEIAWLLTLNNINNGVVFEQKRLLSLDWNTDAGLFLRLFFNDDINQTEFLFSYNLGKAFNSLYITNKFNNLEVNPYRTLSGGKTQDINFGFDWGAKFYKGRFDFQFDSTKRVTDRFRGSKKFVENRTLSSSYERAVSFYLPDRNITEIVQVYSNSSVSGTEEYIEINSVKFKLLEENVDYKIDYVEGTIVFSNSRSTEMILIYYKTSVNGVIYEVGDLNCGIDGIFGDTDFNKTKNPEYFLSNGGKDYLVLYKPESYTFFETKNYYKILPAATLASGLSYSVYDVNNLYTAGFTVGYDQFSGCLKVYFDKNRAVIRNIYPFYDFTADPAVFYLSSGSPDMNSSTHIISYSIMATSDALKLSESAIPSSITVFLNSEPLDSSKFSYDYITGNLVLNFEINDSDILEVVYSSEDEENFNISASLKNDFRINDYLIICDSFWYKMPIKLWEDGYYFKQRSLEFIYNVKFQGDFKKVLMDKSGGSLGFQTNAALSFFYPEIKGLTILEDFEYDLKGIALDLDYRNWFPVNIPKQVFTELASSNYGKLFYKNCHQYNLTSSSVYLPLSDPNVGEREAYNDGAAIGPYSSSDGYNDEKNSLSLILDYELAAGESISIALPVNKIGANLDFRSFTELTVALKALSVSGNVRFYVDAGAITEKFNDTDFSVSKESFDEGINYFIPNQNVTLTKSKSDGVNISNDLNNDGVLNPDETQYITGFIDKDALLPYLNVSDGYKKVANFKIADNSKLEKTRGIRITLYSENGSTGSILINQARLVETGWSFDTSGDSIATEIFPAEDELLAENIFSQNNKEIDAKLHYQRYRERTLRINLAQNDKFYIYKRFINPVDLSNFQYLKFFMFLEKRSSRKLKVSLTDINGNSSFYLFDLAGTNNLNWSEFLIPVSALNVGAFSASAVSEIRFDFENELYDTENNKIFIDEIFLSDPNGYVGFSNFNEFFYSDPGLVFKKREFPIFSSPYVKVTTTFNTQNFLREEAIRSRGHRLTGSLITGFNLLGMEWRAESNLDFLFQNGSFSNSRENLKLKIAKNSPEHYPLIFSLIYDYEKIELAKYDYSEPVSKYRKFQFEIGNIFKYINWKIGADVLNSSKEISNIFTSYYFEMNTATETFKSKIKYSIENEKENNAYFGLFSLDNIQYLFRDDFISFFGEGTIKRQNFNALVNAKLLENLSFIGDFSYNFLSNFNYENRYTFESVFSNKVGLSVNLKTSGSNKKFFDFEYSRNLRTDFQEESEKIYWDRYFSNFANSLALTTTLATYPPFSSLYRKNNGERYFGERTRFNEILDGAKFSWDWSLWIGENSFAPYKFAASFTEKILNSVSYSSLYNLNFLINGKGEVYLFRIKKFTVEYKISESISFGYNSNVFTSETEAAFDFFLFNDVNLSSSLGFLAEYSESLSKKETRTEIALKSKFYKNFFKKDFVKNDKYGVELTVILELLSKFYTTILGTTDLNDAPIEILLTPTIGYRFNRNISVGGIFKLGYGFDYNKNTAKYIHRFGAEVAVEGVLSF